MRRSTFTLSVLTAVAGAMLWLYAVPADATTCSSSCKQIRRACRASARAMHKVERFDCVTERDACRAACLADPLICPDGECDACKTACNEARALCRGAAKDARAVDYAACDVCREDCGNVCQDPVDGECVKACRVVWRKDCVKAARQLYRDNKQLCPTDTQRRACVRTYRSLLNLDLSVCSDEEMDCIGGCIGYTPPAP